MEQNPLDQVKAGCLPQPNAAVARSLVSQDATACPAPAEGVVLHPDKLVPVPTQARAISSRVPNAALWSSQTLRSRWKLYRDRLKECRHGPTADAVHQLRVSARRLISQFVLLCLIVPSGKPEKARRMLRRQLKSLGPLRDSHVQRSVIERQTERFPELLLLWRQLERQERDALRVASRQIHGFRTRKLERWISDLIADLAQQASDAQKNDKLTALAWRCANEAFEEAVRRRRLIDFSAPATIHSTRVAFKKFRYIVESLPPELAGLSKRELRALAWYQRRMGNIQDLQVIQACLAEFLQRHPGAAPLLKPFSVYLQHRRARAVRSFRNSADRLFGFWPLPPTRAESATTRPNGRVSPPRTTRSRRIPATQAADLPGMFV